jgi:hypothetical protein
MQSVEPVVRALEALGVSFALIGAHAVALRGHPRMTVDYDFLTTDARVLAEAPWSALAATGVAVDVRHGDPDDPLAGVVHMTLRDGEEVDLVVGRWKWEQAVIDRAELLDVGPFRVRVPRASDLILLKLSAGGTLDLQDVAVMLEVAGDRAALVRDVEEHLGDLPAHAQRLWRDLATTT